MSCYPVVHACLEKGMKWQEPMTIEDDNGPMDLNGYTASFVAKDSSGAEVINLSSASGGIVLLSGNVPNHILPLLTTAETAALDFDRASAELNLYGPDGEGEIRIRFLLQLSQ